MQDVQDLFDGNKFDEARVAFEAMIAEASSKKSDTMTESAIARQIASAGNEALRLTLQGWFDRRRDQAVAKIEAEPLPAGTEVRLSTRPVESLFGRVRAQRPGLKKGREPSRFSVDREANLPPEPYSLAVRERVAQESIRGSFDASGEAVSRTTGAHVPKRQVEQLAVRAAQDVNAFYAQGLASNDNQTAMSKKALLVATCDSKGIRVLDKALREGTRKKKKALKSKTTKGDPMKRTPGRKHDKRMAIVTAVYEIEPHVRRAKDVVERLGAGKKKKKRKPAPKAQNKHVEASVEQSQAKGIGAMFDEVERRDPEHKRHLVGLVDGEEKQIKQVEKQAKERGISLTLILDLIHVLHYLWMACNALTKKNAAKAEVLVREMLLRLLTGPASYVAAALRQRATILELTPKQRKAVDKCCNYLLKNQAYLNYREYLARGYPIATGVIEGACRHLVQDRMGITGARWGLDTAEAILKLRALHTNGDWDAYWAFHEQQEFERNYAKSA